MGYRCNDNCREGARSSSERGNNLRKSVQSCSCFSGQKTLVQRLFRCSNTRGRLPPRPATVQQIPAILRVQDVNAMVITPEAYFLAVMHLYPRRFPRLAFGGTA